MLYDKFLVVFLNTIISEKAGSTNSVIASYILDHMEEVKAMGVRELAQRCHVGVASISRFCREIGLEDFREMKELLATTEAFYQYPSQQETMELRNREYGERIKIALDQVTASLSLQRLGELCDDLDRYERVAAFGLMKAEAAAVDLQGDMLMLGRKLYTHTAYTEQLRYLRQAGREDLILLFSYTGSYFLYQEEPFHWEKGNRPRIWMICGHPPMEARFLSGVLEFASSQDQVSHPYQLQYVASLIAQEYAVRHREGSS